MQSFEAKKKMKETNIYLLANEPTCLDAAIERYCRYVLNLPIEIITPSRLELPDNFILFISDPDTVYLLETCNVLFLNKISPDKTRIIGSQSHSDINLLDLNNLNASFEKSLYSVDLSIRANNPYFSSQISTFFKGHGEQSLLGCIGWVNYYIGNYIKLAGSREYEPRELNKAFLEPGIQNWNEFKRRFEKYAPLLYFVGWNDDALRINNSINTIEKEIKNIDVTESFHIFGNDTIKLLSDISECIEKMAEDWIQKYEKTNPTNS